MPVRLSVLDQSPVVSGFRPADALAATVELAQAADGWGYHRYWCAEHHGLYGVANPAPEVMIARLGAATRRIRVGSGGVMLPYYSPFKVAEQFLMLEALFPGRIDLGVGRAPGGDLATAQAVAGGHYDRAEHFAEQVAEICALLYGHGEAQSAATGVLLQPAVDSRPEFWMLGSSDYGGRLAAQCGLNFAFAHFINPQYGEVVARQYREQFQPGAHERPWHAVALFVIAAERTEDVERVQKAVDLRRLQMAYGQNRPIPTVAEALARPLTPEERAVVERERPRSIIGTPESVAERMLALKDRFEADEIIVLTVAPSYAERLRSYELIAQAFDLAHAH